MADPTNEAAPTRRLTTHVLDTASGQPALGVAIEVAYLVGDRFALVCTAMTNADGRCDSPLLAGADFRPGTYELRFDVGAYFQRSVPGGFLGVVPVRFTVGSNVRHIHVPLLIAPFGYSTYRGS